MEQLRSMISAAVMTAHQHHHQPPQSRPTKSREKQSTSWFELVPLRYYSRLNGGHWERVHLARVWWLGCDETTDASTGEAVTIRLDGVTLEGGVDQENKKYHVEVAWTALIRPGV